MYNSPYRTHGIVPLLDSSFLTPPPFRKTQRLSRVLIFHLPSNPGNLRLPVRSSCMAPCLIARFFSMSASSEATSASVSERTWAMADCSGRSGNPIWYCENSFQLTPGCPLLMDIIPIQFQYLQVSTVDAKKTGLSFDKLGRALTRNPANTRSPSF